MVDVIIKFYRNDTEEYKEGSVRINPCYTLKEVKNAILKDIGIENPDTYHVIIVPKDEDVKFDKIFGNGCTLEIRKSIKWKIKEEELNNVNEDASSLFDKTNKI